MLWRDTRTDRSRCVVLPLLSLPTTTDRFPLQLWSHSVLKKTFILVASTSGPGKCVLVIDVVEVELADGGKRTVLVSGGSDGLCVSRSLPSIRDLVENIALTRCFYSVALRDLTSSVLDLLRRSFTRWLTLPFSQAPQHFPPLLRRSPSDPRPLPHLPTSPIRRERPRPPSLRLDSDRRDWRRRQRSLGPAHLSRSVADGLASGWCARRYPQCVDAASQRSCFDDSRCVTTLLPPSPLPPTVPTDTAFFALPGLDFLPSTSSSEATYLVSSAVDQRLNIYSLASPQTSSPPTSNTSSSPRLLTLDLVESTCLEAADCGTQEIVIDEESGDSGEVRVVVAGIGVEVVTLSRGWRRS